ncbi:hypothetical protein Lser_V15G40008 [Lactuca serriola]
MVFQILLEIVFLLIMKMLPQVDQGERMSPSSSGGTRNHASPTLPPPPPVILPDLSFLQFEKFKVTQSLLACKHLDGNFVCAHVLNMKSHIERLGMLGVVFLRELAIHLVLVSLPNSYSQFIEDLHEMDHDVTLIDLTYLQIIAEAEMLKSIGQANVFEGSVSQNSMHNSNNGSSEKVSLHNGKGSAKVKPFDHMVKRKASYEIVPCVVPRESICFYCQLKGQWMRSYPVYLKDRIDSKVKLYDSTSEIRKLKKKI